MSMSSVRNACGGGMRVHGGLATSANREEVKKNFLISSPRARLCTLSMQPRPLLSPPFHLPCGPSPRALLGAGCPGFPVADGVLRSPMGISLLPPVPSGYRSGYRLPVRCFVLLYQGGRCLGLSGSECRGRAFERVAVWGLFAIRRVRPLRGALVLSRSGLCLVSGCLCR